MSSFFLCTNPSKHTDNSRTAILLQYRCTEISTHITTGCAHCHEHTCQQIKPYKCKSRQSECSIRLNSVTLSSVIHLAKDLYHKHGKKEADATRNMLCWAAPYSGIMYLIFLTLQPQPPSSSLYSWFIIPKEFSEPCLAQWKPDQRRPDTAVIVLINN